MIPPVNEADRLVCRSCGVPWDQHLGIIGTCARLQASKRLKRYRQFRGKLREHADGEWVKFEDVLAAAEGKDAT